jgi:hypothetical protein
MSLGSGVGFQDASNASSGIFLIQIDASIELVHINITKLTHRFVDTESSRNLESKPWLLSARFSDLGTIAPR